MGKQSSINPQVMDWLLRPDDADPGSVGVRYLALRDLTDVQGEELEAAREKAHVEGPIASVLEKMAPEGYWVKPGAGYSPKYSGTVWSVILLSQLGGLAEEDNRIAAACNYLMDHALTGAGQFSVNGTPSYTIDCLQGNLCSALVGLGCRDSRLEKAFEWMARTVTGEGIAPAENKDAPLRYYAAKCGPDFACGANNRLPCAWGAVKVMLAFSKLPREKRTPVIDRAIKAGVDFLFSRDPAQADYPCGYSSKPSGNWRKFGFPVFYITDILQICEALAGLGYGRDPRLSNALKLIREKQDSAGRWPLETDYTGKTWVDFGEKKKPNKWVTLRALRVLKTASS
jgi:hypothetical protein